VIPLQSRDATYRITSGLHNNERGMTLLEVLVALLIFSMVLVTMLGSFAQAGRQNANAYRYNEALWLAQSKIEEIKEMNFDSVNNVEAKSFSSESDYNQFQGMTYTVNVVDSGFNTKTVTVTVSYEDEGIAKQLDLTAEVVKR
jgi:type II secretion system protein I